MNPKKYYGSKGKYLEEHKTYFSKKQLQKDINFIIDTLKLNKKDKILDLACGNGRHTLEFKKMGFDIEGLDYSVHLLKMAHDNAKQQKLDITFHKCDIHNIDIDKKYDKIFLFFSEFGLFDADKVLKNVSKLLKPNGLFLLDYDNVFRLIQHLAKNNKSSFKFDFVNMELQEQTDGNLRVRYYTVPELDTLLKRNKLKIKNIYGNYEKEELDINSRRIIFIAKKMSS